MKAIGELHAPATSSLGKGPPDTHWLGGWMGLRAGLNAVAERNNPYPAGI